MKKEIHPEVFEITAKCVCGNSFKTSSTKKEISVDICSACHPFCTGTQKFVDTAGRIERFQQRYKKTKAKTKKEAKPKETKSQEATSKEVKPKAKPRIKSSPEPLEKNSHRELPEDSEESLPGDDNYMIQVAAYKNLKDALEQMAILDSKGFSSYRTMGQINDTLWHRVRTGPFKNREMAKKALQKLRKENVQGIIIKKE